MQKSENNVATKTDAPLDLTGTTVFACSRGKKKFTQGPKFKCVRCKEYFCDSQTYRAHVCEKD